MNTLILTELARAWRAQNDHGARDGSDNPAAREFNCKLDGQDMARERCASELEQLIALYAPLDSDRDRTG